MNSHVVKKQNSFRNWWPVADCSESCDLHLHDDEHLDAAAQTTKLCVTSETSFFFLQHKKGSFMSPYVIFLKPRLQCQNPFGPWLEPGIWLISDYVSSKYKIPMPVKNATRQIQNRSLTLHHHVYVCVYVCVCDRERERKREGEWCGVCKCVWKFVKPATWPWKEGWEEVEEEMG